VVEFRKFEAVEATASFVACETVRGSSNADDVW
jgi:hypothetical protein